MQIRFNFVANSSSMSFIIPRSMLNKTKRKKLRHITDPDYDNSWNIFERHDGSVSCFTIMDNYDILKYLRKIGIDTEELSISYS